MEVDRSNFYRELGDIIETISSSQSVCIDLEMSGISTQTGEQERFKMSLGDLYKRAKEAAEAFTILQIGLTCVSWDQEEGEYITKTYNIPLSPSIAGDDPLSKELAGKVERLVSFSSQSINFLLANNFDLAKVFERGVPYLSVAEAGQSQLVGWVKDKDMAFENRINIQELPEETQKFYHLMQANVQEWITARKFGEYRSKALILSSPYDGRFSRFQKRLIHQLLDTHFFEYRAHSKQGSMSMEISRRPKFEKKNGRVQALRTQALMKLTGFRFIWEALTGGFFAKKIDIETIVGQDPEAIIALRQRLLECEARLRKKRPIIVGHNMLHDLCFLFKTFQGKLPATVREFHELVCGKLFKIVDTKYMMTHGHHEMMPDQSLEECFNALCGDTAVSIRAMSDAFGYKKAMSHQAGYDSFMTATVFLKKAYQLSQAEDVLSVIPHENGGAVARMNSLRVPQQVSHLDVRNRTAIKSDSLMDDDDNDDDSLASLAKSFEPLKPMIGFASTSVKSSEEWKTSGGEDGGKAGGKIPEWDEGALWKRYGNRVRVGPAMMLYTGF